MNCMTHCITDGVGETNKISVTVVCDASQPYSVPEISCSILSGDHDAVVLSANTNERHGSHCYWRHRATTSTLEMNDAKPLGLSAP